MSKDLRDKVNAIFHELVGERVTQLHPLPLPPSRQIVEDALAADFEKELPFDIAFHLLDWGKDAAFIVALHLFPERFTQEEIREGIGAFLSHAPNHVAAAAKLYGQPVQDIFEIGALDGYPDDEESS